MGKQKIDAYSKYSQEVIEKLVKDVMTQLYKETEFWPESWRQHFVMRMDEELNLRIAPAGVEMEL